MITLERKEGDMERPHPLVLRRLMSYDPETGILKWKDRVFSDFNCDDEIRAKGLAAIFNKKFSGTEALGYPCRGGYKGGTLLGLNMKAHIVAWAIHHGRYPEKHIDHINRRRQDNRACNLREATPGENARNKGLHKRNKSGYPGVRYLPKDKKWVARIGVDGKHKDLGRFKTKEEALSARTSAEAKYGYVTHVE